MLILLSMCVDLFIFILQLIDEQRAYLARVQPVVNYLHNLIIDLGLDNEEKIEEVKQ